MTGEQRGRSPDGFRGDLATTCGCLVRLDCGKFDALRKCGKCSDVISGGGLGRDRRGQKLAKRQNRGADCEDKPVATGSTRQQFRTFASQPTRPFAFVQLRNLSGHANHLRSVLVVDLAQRCAQFMFRDIHGSSGCCGELVMWVQMKTCASGLRRPNGSSHGVLPPGGGGGTTRSAHAASASRR